MQTTGTVRLATLAVVALAAGILTAAPIAAETAWPPLGGDLPVTSMVESDDIRRALWTSHYTDTMDHVLSRKDTIKKNAWGSWTASVDTGAGAFYIIVAPERGGSWPVYAQGSWIVKRSSADGSFMQAKIFLRSDPGTFVRVYPAGSRSRMDIIAYGGVLYREVPVPLPFADLLRSPFSRIRHLTADVVDWDLFSQDPALYADLLRLSDSVSAHLPELRYADDGAIDYDGSAVYISTLLEQKSPPGLNCSGFVKWLVDGILHPITGEYLSVAMLRERMTGWRGSSFTQALEEAYDPFFGLDWSRALAKAAWSALYPSSLEESPLANDVSETPFALRVKDAEPVNGGSSYEAFADNFEDAGIDIRGLKATLFVLAAREPGRFYLAQFNARDKNPPRLRRYFHIAALFPYFDDQGVFRVRVFESAAETSLDRILADRDYEFVKLVRMPSSPRFEPPVLAAR